MHKRRVTIAALALATLVVVSGCSRIERYRYGRVMQRASTASKEGRHADAAAAWEQAVGLCPDADSARYNLACSWARAGDKERALTALEAAVQHGYLSNEHAGRDEDLVSLHEEPRFKAALEGMQANATRFHEHWSARHRVRGPASAASFDSSTEIDKRFDGALERLERKSWCLSFTGYWDEKWTLVDEKAAALQRYVADHPAAKDREDAGREYVQTVLKLHDFSPTARWDADGEAVAVAVEWFLATFPDTSDRPMMEYQRVVASLLSRPLPVPRKEGEPAPPPEDVQPFIDRFLAVEKQYPGTDAAGRAMYVRAILLFQKAQNRLTPELSALLAEFKQKFGENEDSRSFSARYGRELRDAARDWKAFSVTDTAGTRWDAASMKGKVVLVDFWATWCGPCVGELPNLRKAYEKYHAKGFEIVGVSLDDDDRKAFGAFLEKNGIKWPQAYDGKGWSTAIARQYEIRGIPTNVLFDRDGNVAALELRGDAVEREVGRLIPD